jgi:MFS superfamily sulfate permease-like transporter
MGLPGTASAPIHLSGGMKIDNLDATALVAAAFAFSFVSFVIAIAAIVVAIFALVRQSDSRAVVVAPPLDQHDGEKNKAQ